MFEKILLAVDGSAHALRAASQAADLARNMNSKELRVIVSYDPIPIYLGEPNMQLAYVNRKDESEKILNDALKVIGEVPAKVITQVLEGDTATRLIEAAEVNKSDVIVLGSRGLGSLAGLLLGSVSQKVVSHAPCPVLIVR